MVGLLQALDSISRIIHNPCLEFSVLTVAKSSHLAYLSRYCLESSPRISKQKKTRKNLSIQTELQLLADVDKKQGTKRGIAEKYSIPHNTLSSIGKNRAKLEITGLPAEFQPLFLWFKQARAMSASISTPVLSSQAFKSLQFMSKTSFYVLDGRALCGFSKSREVTKLFINQVYFLPFMN